MIAMKKPWVSIIDHRVLDRLDLKKEAQSADLNASRSNSVTRDYSTQCPWYLSDLV